MRPELIDLIKPYYSISIIGMAKNAGKTTVLNEICRQLFKAGEKIGLTSIGRDGESVDIVTSTEKPEIYVLKGTVIATAAQLLEKSDITKEILMTTGINTPMGEVVFVNSLSGGYVQIGGASINSQIKGICDDFKQFGVKKVFVDGAISRKTMASPSVTDATILCTGASLHTDINTVVEETAHTLNMLMLPQFEGDLPDLGIYDEKVLIISNDENKVIPLNLAEFKPVKAEIKYIYLKGAISDTLLSKLIMSNIKLMDVKIIVEDSSKIFASKLTYEKLKIKGAQVFVKEKINVIALTVNPVSAYGNHFDKNGFLEKMSEVVNISVFNVKS